MAMVYNLVSAAQEWLSTRQPAAAAGAVDEEAEAKKKRDEEEAKRTAARAHGTHVTVEAFMAWKRKFDAEKAAEKTQQLENSKTADDIKMQRLTGRQWFQKQEASGAVESSDEDAISSETEINQEELSSDERRQAGEDYDDDEVEDFEYTDDDDDGMLDEYLASKQK